MSYLRCSLTGVSLHVCVINRDFCKGFITGIVFSAKVVSHFFPWTLYCEHPVTSLKSLWWQYSISPTMQMYNKHASTGGCLVCFHTVLFHLSIVYSTSRSIRRAFVNSWWGWLSHINKWRKEGSRSESLLFSFCGSGAEAQAVHAESVSVCWALSTAGFPLIVPMKAASLMSPP